MIFDELKLIRTIVWDAHGKINQKFQELETAVGQHKKDQLTQGDIDMILQMLDELKKTFPVYDEHRKKFMEIEDKIHDLLH